MVLTTWKAHKNAALIELPTYLLQKKKFARQIGNFNVHVQTNIPGCYATTWLFVFNISV